MVTIAKLHAKLMLDAADFHSGIDTAVQKSDSFISKITKGFATFGLAAGGVTAVTSSVKGLANTLGFGLNKELEDVTAQINAFTKDSGKTAEILAQVRSEANQTPFAFREMATAAGALLPITKSTGIGLQDLLKNAEILAASNPFEGLAGASFSLKEAMSGDFTSIIERFNLSRTTINKLKAEGVPNLEIVRRAMLEMGFDSDLVAAKAQTLGGRWSTFMDAIDGVRMKLSKPLFDLAGRGLDYLSTLMTGSMPQIEHFADLFGAGLAQGLMLAGQGLQALGEFIGPLVAKVMELAPVWASVLGPAAAGVLTNLQTGLGLVADVAGRVADVVGGALSAAWQTLQPLVMPVVQFLRDNLEPIATAVLGVVGAVAGWEAAVAVLGAVATPVLGAIVAVLGAILSPIGLIAVAVAALAVAWEHDWGGIQEKVQAVADWLREHVPAALDAVRERAAAVIGALRDQWDPIRERAQAVWDGVRSAIQTVMAEVAGRVGEGVSVVRGHWDEIRAAGVAALELLRAAVVSVLSFIQSQFAVVGQFVGDNWRQALEALTNVVKVALGLILIVWRAFGDDLLAIIRIAWDAVRGVVEGAIQVILGVVKVLISLLTADWQGAWDGIKMITQGAWQVITSLVEGGIRIIVQLITGIGSALGDLSGILVDAGRKLITGLANGVREAAEGALKSTLGWVTKMIPEWKGPPAEDRALLRPTGVMIMDGFTDGIHAGVAGVAAALGEVTAIVAAANDDIYAQIARISSQSSAMSGTLRETNDNIRAMTAQLIEWRYQLEQIPAKNKAARQALEDQIDAMEHQRSLLTQSRSALSQLLREQQDGITTLDGATRTWAALNAEMGIIAQYGNAAAGAIMSVRDALTDLNSPAAGEKAIRGIMTLALKAKEEGVQNWQELAQACVDAFTFALEDGLDAAEREGRIRAAFGQLGEFEQTIKVAVTLDTSKFDTALANASAGLNLSDTLGPRLQGVWDALNAAIDGGGEKAIGKLGGEVAKLNAQFSKILPPDLAAQAQSDLGMALRAVIDNPTEETRQRLIEVGGQWGAAVDAWPKSFDKLPAAVQQAMNATLIEFRAAAIGPQEYQARMDALATAAPAIIAKLPEGLRASLDVVRGLFMTRQIGLDEFVERSKVLTEDFPRGFAKWPLELQNTFLTVRNLYATGEIDLATYQGRSGALIQSAMKDWDLLPASAAAALASLQNQLSLGIIGETEYERQTAAIKASVKGDWDELDAGLAATMDSLRAKLASHEIDLRQFNERSGALLSITEKRWQELPAALQVAVRGMAQQVEWGTLSAQQFGAAWDGISKLLPPSFAQMGTGLQLVITNLINAWLAGAITFQQASEGIADAIEKIGDKAEKTAKKVTTAAAAMAGATPTTTNFPGALGFPSVTTTNNVGGIPGLMSMSIGDGSGTPSYMFSNAATSAAYGGNLAAAQYDAERGLGKGVGKQSSLGLWDALPGWTWVGERGPELMHVPKGATIMPHRQSMEAAGGSRYPAGGGSEGQAVTIEQHFHGSNMQPGDMMRAQRMALWQAGIDLAAGVGG